MSVLIKGGRVITAADDYVADVFIEGERISLIGESLDLSADKVIDASGKYVLPGAVDPHTHLEMPWRGETTIDDYESGQTAAAFGGTTTHVDFCIQGKGQSFAEALEIWHGKREGKAVIDNGFHIAITDLSSDEMTLVLDDSEVPLAAGSVVVQRGTNHAWANRSGRPCRMLFVLVDGRYDPALAEALARRQGA